MYIVMTKRIMCVNRKMSVGIIFTCICKMQYTCFTLSVFRLNKKANDLHHSNRSFVTDKLQHNNVKHHRGLLSN